MGLDEDLIIIDPKKKYKISKDNMFTQAKNIAKVFDGWEVYGVPRKTILRGQVIYEDGLIKGKSTFGKVLIPYSRNWQNDFFILLNGFFDICNFNILIGLMTKPRFAGPENNHRRP